MSLLDALNAVLTVPLFRAGSITLTLGWLLETLLLLGLVLLVTVGAKRLLKGVVLAKLGIDQGNREALSTLVSYSLGALGLILVIQGSGVDLASLAIVAGGLGVGVGFGLQDGAKNLISGLTLLLERKLKVGDFIDLEGTTGYIKEIAIRSTVIQTLDGGDIIVPNSYLVENKILNWTYTNLTGQIRLTVGVDYRSNPLVVVEALLACARREPAVLTQPPPKVVFKGFGESSLDFELWAWIDCIDKRILMRSRLYFLVEAELRQRGIAIPYPHLDLALRNPEVLRPDWHPNEGRPAGPALAEQLRQLSYFADYTDWQLREMVEIGYRLNLKAGEVLLAEGDRISNFYIVLSGRLNIFNSQVSRCIETIGPGEYCGEVGLILNIARSFVTFQAGAETTLFVVPQQHACHFLRSHTRLQEAVNRTLTSRQEKVQDLREQLEAAGLLPPESETGNFVVWLRRQFHRFINREAA